ncbi:uncharacterized protein METZ01_LOCUS154534 [marine metagenome]|uniref:Uncharacterized protein n=1 Tax=marine metagenome TaxID=408172 RepID=A0A382AJD1_9ZZZZ
MSSDNFSPKKNFPKREVTESNYCMFSHLPGTILSRWNWHRILKKSLYQSLSKSVAGRLRASPSATLDKFAIFMLWKNRTLVQ